MVCVPTKTMIAPSSSATAMGLIERYSWHGRRRRFSWIRRMIRRPANRSLRLLDVGGTVDYWAAMPWQSLAPVEIVLLNVRAQEAAGAFTAIVGDARDLSQYADQSFDVVYSNSVIGHVGDFDDQRRMANEVQRVGRQFILQTPNQRFPIDWRTLMPGFHFLPVDAQAWCLQRYRVGRYPRMPDPERARITAARVRNVTRGELGVLFPGAVIYAERVCGLTKSFVVVGGLGTPNEVR